MTTTTTYQTPSSTKVEISTLQVLANNNYLEFLRLANEFPQHYAEFMEQAQKTERIVEQMEELKQKL